MDFSAQQAEMEQLRKAEEIKRTLIRNIMEREAVERLGRVRIVKPELAEQLELYLIQMYQAGQIKGKITEAQLKQILSMLTAKKEISIKRR